MLSIFVHIGVTSSDAQQVQQGIGQLQLSAGSSAAGAVGGATGGSGTAAGARQRPRRGALQYIAPALRPQGVERVEGLLHILSCLLSCDEY
jgi:hypothetical protein